MAKKKSEIDKLVSLPEKEYLELLEAQMTLNALKIAGVEELPLYKGIKSIIEDGRVEIHNKPIQKRYR
ncbi:hypothetical protein [Dysgonomonas termitidis]|uniref:Transposase n=1 Tax=Dysgonomonas termitidis TaxID=1516126 RepID=A0ABV9L3Y1_9BACT